MFSTGRVLLAALLLISLQPLADLRISRPQTLLELKSTALKGVPTRLAWAPNGSELYVRISQFDRWANETVTHAIVSLATREVTPAAIEPSWASAYWVWKSARTSPAVVDWQFAFDAHEEQIRTTNVPRGGDIAGFMAEPGAGYDELAQKAIFANQKARIETLRLNGRVIDRTINTSLVPGRRFGWAPPPRQLLAFATGEGRLALLDRENRITEVKGTSKVLLPAWSEDGTRIAFIERVKSDRYAVRLITVE